MIVYAVRAVGALIHHHGSPAPFRPEFGSLSGRNLKPLDLAFISNQTLSIARIIEELYAVNSPVYREARVFKIIQLWPFLLHMVKML